MRERCLQKGWDPTQKLLGFFWDMQNTLPSPLAGSGAQVVAGLPTQPRGSTCHRLPTPSRLRILVENQRRNKLTLQGHTKGDINTNESQNAAVSLVQQSEDLQTSVGERYGGQSTHSPVK